VLSRRTRGNTVAAPVNNYLYAVKNSGVKSMGCNCCCCCCSQPCCATETDNDEKTV
jgi:hypothetical protein